ncbi:MAG: hypothetical protein HRT53_05425 [Colwellia sp.]|nr:hypothetical protein [Colwellia sp.]
MNDDKSWQKPLDNFLAKNDISADTRVLARALSIDKELTTEKYNQEYIADMEQALHIEQHLNEIGLQALPTGLANKLQAINQTDKSDNVVFGKFKPSWQKISALAATVTAVALLNSNMLSAPTNQQPTLAEIQHAQQELALALQYISFAKTKSARQIKQAFDENIQQPLNQSLFAPLNHFKETS